jgi:putative MFS transporter
MKQPVIAEQAEGRNNFRPPVAATSAESAFTPEVANGKRMTYIEFLDNSPMTPFLWILLIGVALAQILDGINFQSTAFALPLIGREFKINPTAAGLIASMTGIGLFFGALIISPLADRFGRKPIFQWVLFTYAFGAFLSAIAWSYESLLVARVIAGLGIGAQFPVAFALLAEFAPKRLRHIFVALGPLFYSVGWFCCAMLSTWLIPRFGWRAIYWLGISSMLMTVYIWRLLPESPRFLLMRGKVKEAGNVVKDLARRAGMTEVELVAPPETNTKAVEKLSLSQRISALRPEFWSVLALGGFYFANSIQNTGFSTWLPSIFVGQGFTLTRSFRFATIILVVTPIGQLFAMWLQERMPRKWAMLLLATLSSAFFLAFGLSFEFKWPIEVMVGSNVFYQFFSQGIVVILYTLATELFPTRIRGSSMGLITAVGRIGAITGPFVVGLLSTLGTAIHQIIYYFAIPLLAAAILCLFLIRIDPRQKTLEQIHT